MRTAVLLLMLVPLAHAQPDEQAATAARLLIRSGLAVQLGGLSAQFESAIRENGAKLDERMVAALSTATKEAFRPEALREDITALIAKRVAVADMKAALTWLESGVGQRVTRAEELSATTFQPDALREYAVRLKAKPIGTPRQKLLSELIAATDAVRLAAGTQETIALGVALGMDSLQPRERRIGEAELLARLRAAMPPNKVREALAQDMPLLMAYTYRDISDADLRGYIDFLKSGAGKRYQDGTVAAFIEGLARASRRVGELVARRQFEATLGVILQAALLDPPGERFGRALPARVEHHRVPKPLERTEFGPEQARG